MPTPNKGETQKDFLKRCIPMVIKEGTAKFPRQGAAICISLFKKKKNNKKKSSTIF